MTSETMLPTKETLQKIFESADKFVALEKPNLSDMDDQTSRETLQHLLDQSGLATISRAFGPNEFTSGPDSSQRVSYQGKTSSDGSIVQVYETRDDMPSRVFYFFPNEQRPSGITCCITFTDIQHGVQGDAYIDDKRRFYGITQSKFVQNESDFPPLAFSFQLP